MSRWNATYYTLCYRWKAILAVVVLLLILASLSYAWVQTTKPGGGKEHWRERTAAFTFQLGCQDTARIEQWGPCWDDVLRHAIEAWNDAGSRFRFTATPSRPPTRPACQSPDDTNVVTWGQFLCGQPLQSGTLAITGNWSYRDGVLLDSDIVFNTYFAWGAYAGPYHYNQPDLHRVAIHEFGHALGLTHPDDHGQWVEAIMNSLADDTETLQADDREGAQAIYGRDPNRVAPVKGALGNPGHQTYASGVGVISGWVCEAQRVEVQIGTKRIRMAYGTDRPDTRGVCGDADNGFVTLVNYNNFGDGVHTARLVVDGQQIGQPAQFKVTTLGTDFLRGAEGGYWLHDFPRVGEDVGIGWNQGRQNFVIEERR